MCWKYHPSLHAHQTCQDEIEERDIMIDYLQKINYSHEKRIRHILNQYRNEGNLVCDKILDFDESEQDLHNQLHSLVSFYKTRSDNTSTELENWKKIAVEARTCREKEAALFESQLSLISKEYYAKYENFRGSFEREKSRRLVLEDQTQSLSCELEECRKKLYSCQKELEALRGFHESLIINNITNIKTVTQRDRNHETARCSREFAFQMADFETGNCDFSTGQQEQEGDTEIQTKHENTECLRDSSNIVEISDPIEDALVGTTASEPTKPVVASLEMEKENSATLNGSTVPDSREDTSDQSQSLKAPNLCSKNKEPQVCSDALMKERNSKSGEEYNSGQQCSTSSTECETYVNEIQQLKKQLENASLKCSSLEKANSDLKAENQQLELLVQELQTRIAVLESQIKLANTGANMANVAKSNEVDEAKSDAAKEVEDALNESLAAQDLADRTPDIPKTTEVNGSIIKAEPTRSENNSIQEELSASTGKKQSPHSSLARNKLPSAASTAPIPFGKRHSHAGMTHRPRNRTGSTEIERRVSVGSDLSDTHVDEETKPKQMPVKKYSTSHLDAFKPKPFMKKQASLSDDIHLYSRTRIGSSKSGSTGSASDTESAHDNQQEGIESPVEAVPPISSETQTEPSSKPYDPLPKAHQNLTDSNPERNNQTVLSDTPNTETSNETDAKPVAQDANVGELV